MSEFVERALGESRIIRERSMALEAVLTHAGNVGIDKAIEKFGGPLTNTEKELVKSLKPEEFKALEEIRRKLGHLGSLAKDNNNNIL